MPKKYKEFKILDQLLEGFQIIDRKWTYVYVNDTVALQGKSSKDELIGKTMMEAYPGIENTPLFDKLRACMESGRIFQFENEFKFPDGSLGWYDLRIEPVENGIIILSSDITERKRAENELKNLKDQLEEKVNERTKELRRINEEKDVILQEMHHRVKNNLQIISSLLNLQIHRNENEECNEQLRKTVSRIETIAKVHESLYNEYDLSLINVSKYINSLLKANIDSMKVDQQTIKHQVNSEGITLSLDKMIPLGMLINELTINSLAHGFKNANEGEISVSITKKGDEFILKYCDNGTGFDISKIDMSKNLGYYLIEGFVDQIDGIIKNNHGESGMCIEVIFK